MNKTLNLSEIVWERDVTVYRVEASKLKELPVLDNDQDQLPADNCRECQSSTDLSKLLSACNCMGERAYIHFHCLKGLIETSGEEKCGICGQNWLGIEFVKKRKGFTDFLRENSKMFLTFAKMFQLFSFSLSCLRFCPKFKLI